MTDDLTPEQLIEIYADDPAVLDADERRAVEALCARDPGAARMLAESRAALTVLRAAATTGEPDWSRLAADIGVAVDGAARKTRRTRTFGLAGAVLAAAAVATLLVWPAARRGDHDPRAGATTDAATGNAAVDVGLTDEEVAAELAVPDDLGGITVDDDLIDEAAAALADEHLDRDGGDDGDDGDDQLLPDGTWIDDLSDDELDRAIAWLDGEAG